MLVGHSHYFRELHRDFRHPSCTLADASSNNPAAPPSELDPAELDSKKLSNVGVARCEFDFGVSSTAPVVSVELLFDTALV